MAWLYFDTSALVKRYASERGTAWVTTVTDPARGQQLWTVRLTGPELVAALFRKVRAREMSRAAATRAGRLFRAHWLQQYYLVEAAAPIIDEAMDLAERHGLRGYDAVHLAAALSVERFAQAAGLASILFLSADDSELQAARAEGLAVDNPNLHP